MGAQHTPGPWEVRGGTVIAPNESNPYVADLSSPRGAEVRDADARLIAAAPEMLEALKRQVGACFDPECRMCSEHQALIDKIEAAAISRALPGGEGK